jgi:undecaprenyl diphosphate synthase
MTLTVAFDYGSRAEIVEAARRALRSARPITVETITAGLYLPDMPPVDVLVRTSGEHRVSNFLLWQSQGAPTYYTAHTWPEFSAEDLDAAISLVE